MFIIQWIIGFFRGIFNRHRARRRTHELLAQNQRARDVMLYYDSPVEAFYALDMEGNIIVSGNNAALRNRVLTAAAYHRCQRRIPVIILHCGNKALERLVADAYERERAPHIINAEHPEYDPFTELRKEEISQMVISSSGSDNKVERIGGLYINGLTDYLLARGRRPMVRSYISCPHDAILSRVMEHRADGSMSEADATRISSEITQGKAEQGNVEQYFRVLDTQASCILARKAEDAISIRKAIEEGKTIMLDIVSASNILLINLLVQEITDAMARGKRFLLAIDGIPVDASEGLARLMKNYSNACNFVYSSSDFYADTQSTANTFETLLAKATMVYVMQHSAAQSGKKFSEYFGQYRPVEINTTYVSGTVYPTYGQLLPGTNSSDVQTTQLTDRPRIEERDIAELAPDEMFIKRNSEHEIMRVRCTAGEATGMYEAPRRRGRWPRLPAVGVNWALFVLLLLVPPAAFIYLFAVGGRVGKIVSAIVLVLMLVGVIVSNVLSYIALSG